MATTPETSKYLKQTKRWPYAAKYSRVMSQPLKGQLFTELNTVHFPVCEHHYTYSVYTENKVNFNHIYNSSQKKTWWQQITATQNVFL